MQNPKIIKFLNTKNYINNCFQFIKFSIVGALNTIISIVFYYIFLKLGLFYIIANTLAYVAGMINSYILNKIWVFKANVYSKITILKFTIVNLVSLILSNSLLYLMINGIGFNRIFAQLPVIFVILTINYSVNKIWTFRK